MATDKHDWKISLYELSKDRLTVRIGEVCKNCGQRCNYERPNKRLEPK